MVNESTMTRRELKSRLWEIIRTEGIEVTNQNLDWLLERAWESAEVTDVPPAETIEKQIEEMAKGLATARNCICIGSEKPCNECNWREGCYFIECCKALTDRGYRKASEVAAEIFAEIDKIAYKLMNSPLYSIGDTIFDLEELKNKYTESEE